MISEALNSEEAKDLEDEITRVRSEIDDEIENRLANLVAALKK